MPARLLIICLLALTAASLTAPGPAAAATPAPLAGEPVIDPQVNAWLVAAQQRWQQTPPCPSGIWVVRGQHHPEPGVWAVAQTPGCSIALDPDFYPAPAGADPVRWAVLMCAVISHEWGHLLGHPHDPDPASLMFPMVPAAAAPLCAAPISPDGQPQVLASAPHVPAPAVAANAPAPMPLPQSSPQTETPAKGFVRVLGRERAQMSRSGTVLVHARCRDVRGCVSDHIFLEDDGELYAEATVRPLKFGQVQTIKARLDRSGRRRVRRAGRRGAIMRVATFEFSGPRMRIVAR